MNDNEFKYLIFLNNIIFFVIFSDSERIQMIQNLNHVPDCRDQGCEVTGCLKIKNLIQHYKICEIKTGGVCRVCKLFLNCHFAHLQICQNNECLLQNCVKLREIRKQKAQQLKR